jgi:hypothetical protein
LRDHDVDECPDLSSPLTHRISAPKVLVEDHQGQAVWQLGHQGRHGPQLLTGGVLDDEECMQPAQGDRLLVGQVAGQDRLRVCAQELVPRRFGTARRRG